ncbi:MAG: hypothetical protein PW786_13910 [Arachidicoccus sp.]|nr:hypothetical protein [Arachidicoccus sp.]
MKTFIFICVIVLGVIFSSFTKSAKERKIYYYFCTSNIRNNTSTQSGNIFTYTGIHKLKGNETLIKEKTQAWGDFIKRNCSNINGYSSDLNYYDTKEKAQKVYNEILKDYLNKNGYILKKVNF